MGEGSSGGFICVDAVRAPLPLPLCILCMSLCGLVPVSLLGVGAREDLREDDREEDCEESSTSLQKASFKRGCKTSGGEAAVGVGVVDVEARIGEASDGGTNVDREDAGGGDIS